MAAVVADPCLYIGALIDIMHYYGFDGYFVIVSAELPAKLMHSARGGRTFKTFVRRIRCLSNCQCLAESVTVLFCAADLTADESCGLARR